jgi:adenosylcobinamide-phosphate synthase
VIRVRGASVATALLADALLGEPPETIHPVVFMGRAISAFERRALALKNARRARLAGLFLAVTLPVLSFALARGALCLAPPRLRWIFEVALLSTTLSMRGLARSALAVASKLEGGDIASARVRVGAFVGRDTAHLSPKEVSRAAIESVAENASDGVVAPMLYGLLLGAPGALAYKAVNTLDSMVGHPHPPYENLGWASARLDDFANLVPSRLTTLLAATVSGFAGGSGVATTLAVANRYGPLTKSPNAGWAEAAFAGALGLKLGGSSSYGGALREGPVLGIGRAPGTADILRAVRLMRLVCLSLTGLALVTALAGVRADG